MYITVNKPDYKYIFENKNEKDKDGNATGTQLTITNADSSDAGDYTCTSANTHGERTRSVHVTVTTSSFKRATIQESSKLLAAQSST